MAGRLENDVVLAFEILLEEIELAVENLNRLGAEEFGKGNYQAAQDLSKKGEQMTSFREKVQALQKEWKSLFAPGGRSRKTVKKRLERGMRTPEEFFRDPILAVLLELGGSASMNQVLDGVYRKVKASLNKYDLQPLPSDPGSKRWRNTAQWCRLALVREGLLRSDSPRGTWELTEEGKKQATKLMR